jgi:hypothetical protein
MTQTIRNADHYRILSAFARGKDIAVIAAELGMRNDYVAGVVSSIASLNRAHARELVAEHDRQRTVAPTPAALVLKPQPAEPEPAPAEPPSLAVVPNSPVLDELGELAAMLAEAEATGLPRARTLAGRIRRDLVELDGILQQVANEAEARARIERAKKELADAETRLRELRGGKPAAPTTRPVRAEGDPTPAEVRAWCREHGISCSEHGRVPQAAMDAWREAHR